jgi:hypothetical protein
MRGACIVPLLVCLVALCACQGEEYTLAQQQADTAVADISCDTDTGCFIVSIFNGYVEERVFYVEGHTAEVDGPLTPVPVQLAIPARQSGELHLLGPTSNVTGECAIYGVRTVLAAWIVNHEGAAEPATQFAAIADKCQ